MSKKKLDPSGLFDWYFSDISPRDGARYHALFERRQHTLKLNRLYKIDSIIHFALWNQLPKGHPVGELWLETNTDVEATIYLAYGGFFRQALTILRSWFEIAVHGIYFSFHYGQPTSRYAQWRNGKRDAPANMTKIMESVLSRYKDQSCDHAVRDALKDLTPTYALLCEHAHGQGLDIHDLQEGRDNVPRFLPRSYDMWFETMFRAFDTIYRLYGLLFGEEIRTYLQSASGEHKRLDKHSAHLAKELPYLRSCLQDIRPKRGEPE